LLSDSNHAVTSKNGVAERERRRSRQRAVEAASSSPRVTHEFARAKFASFTRYARSTSVASLVRRATSSLDLSCSRRPALHFSLDTKVVRFYIWRRQLCYVRDQSLPDLCVALTAVAATPVADRWPDDQFEIAQTITATSGGAS